MRKTLFGITGAAALVFSINARASDVGRGTAADGLRDEGRGAAPVMVQRQDAHTVYDEERSGSEPEAVKPCDASMGAGSASGEPSARAKRSTTTEEFLRDVWTAP